MSTPDRLLHACDGSDAVVRRSGTYVTFQSKACCRIQHGWDRCNELCVDHGALQMRARRANNDTPLSTNRSDIFRVHAWRNFVEVVCINFSMQRDEVAACQDFDAAVIGASGSQPSVCSLRFLPRRVEESFAAL